MEGYQWRGRGSERTRSMFSGDIYTRARGAAPASSSAGGAVSDALARQGSTARRARARRRPTAHMHRRGERRAQQRRKVRGWHAGPTCMCLVPSDPTLQPYKKTWDEPNFVSKQEMVQPNSRNKVGSNLSLHWTIHMLRCLNLRTLGRALFWV